MTDMLVAYGLAKSPFPIVPDAHVIHWAGRPEVKELLLDIARSVLIDDTGLSEFVVLHGDYGAGKTHALKYLATRINETDRESFESLAIYMPKIKVGSKLSFLQLYRRIIQEISTERIQALSVQFSEKVDTEASRLSDELPSHEVRNVFEQRGGLEPLVIEQLSEDDQAMARLLLRIAQDDGAALSFLTDGKTPAADSDYSQPISTDFDAVHVLADFFRVLTSPIGNEPPVLKGVHLLVDEAEDAVQAKASEQAELWGSIRELVNRMPYRMALLIAFTAEAAFLEAVMPEAVLERTTRRNVELQALEVEEAKSFIAEHLANHRPEGFNSENPYYPFEEAAVEVVLEREPILVPRKIFRNFRQILERAIRREGLAPGESIDAGLAASIIEGLGI